MSSDSSTMIVDCGGKIRPRLALETASRSISCSTISSSSSCLSFDILISDLQTELGRLLSEPVRAKNSANTAELDHRAYEDKVNLQSVQKDHRASYHPNNNCINILVHHLKNYCKDTSNAYHSHPHSTFLPTVKMDGFVAPRNGACRTAS